MTNSQDTVAKPVRMEAVKRIDHARELLYKECARIYVTHREGEEPAAARQIGVLADAVGDLTAARALIQ